MKSIIAVIWDHHMHTLDLDVNNNMRIHIFAKREPITQVN